MEKIFLVSSSDNDNFIYSIASKLIEANDSLNIARKFSSETDEETIYKYKKSINDIILDYKNNSLMYVTVFGETENIGITLDEYYNKDIFCMNYQEFNSMSEFILRDPQTLVVWVDSCTKTTNKRDINECKVFSNSAMGSDSVKHLYFYNDPIETISDTILEYIESNIEKKKEILEDFA